MKDLLKKLALKLLDLLRYPSTYQGIVGFLTAVGVTVKPELAEQIAAAGVAVVALIHTFVTDADVKDK